MLHLSRRSHRDAGTRRAKMTTDSRQVDVEETVQELRAIVDHALSTLVRDQRPAGLYDPVRYVLQGGGKRLRPILTLLAADIYDVDRNDALPAALAIEVFHNFTLVHDDIMDHAEERRGRPTVHVRWDESTAILCGDYLLGLSYELLSQCPTGETAKIISRFQQMVARLCEGQMLDKEFESRPHVSVAEYLEMVDSKTGALLCASLEIGGMLGGAAVADIRALSEIGSNVGRAFQMKDDLLDLTADDDRWGKTIGGDLIEGKKTYLLLRAIERTSGDDRSWLLDIVRNGGLSPSRVDDARERMRRSGVLEEARREVIRYSQAALDSTHRLPDVPAVDTLRWLLARMQERLH